jgi:DNA-binding NarL/FixJ family response regulator
VSDEAPFRILLIEDNALFARALVAMISAEAEAATPIRVDVAGSLAQAREHLKTRTYQSVLCDPGLPDSRGASTVVEVCELAKKQGAIVTVVTGGMDSEGAHEALKRTVGIVMKDKLRMGSVIDALYSGLDSIEPAVIQGAIDSVRAARDAITAIRLHRTDAGAP